jgi:hypothetical protein
MFSFFRNVASTESSPAIQQALVHQGLPLGVSVNRLRVLTRKGNYAGRSVHYFRAFDVDQAAKSGVAPRTFNELDAHPQLIVGSGHIERDGAVALIRRDPSTTAASPSRTSADRAGHADDAHLVFWGAESSHGLAASGHDAASTGTTEPALLKDR